MSDLSPQDVERIAAAVAARMESHSAADVAAAAAHKAVQEMTIKGMALMGVNLADQKQIEQLKADLWFIRSMRHFTERTGRQVASAITNAVIWGIVGLLVIGFLFWSRNGIAPGTASPPAHISK